MDIVEKYLKEDLNEARNDIKLFADNIVRLLVGDKTLALMNLKKIKFDFDFQSLNPEEYNKAYEKLYKAIHATLQKELRDMLLGVM